MHKQNEEKIEQTVQDMKKTLAATLSKHAGVFAQAQEAPFLGQHKGITILDEFGNMPNQFSKPTGTWEEGNTTIEAYQEYQKKHPSSLKSVLEGQISPTPGMTFKKHYPSKVPKVQPQPEHAKPSVFKVTTVDSATGEKTTGKSINALDIEKAVSYITYTLGLEPYKVLKMKTGEYYGIKVFWPNLPNDLLKAVIHIHLDTEATEKLHESLKKQPEVFVTFTDILQQHKDGVSSEDLTNIQAESKWREIWGIDEFKLHKACADFYLLYELTVTHPENTQAKTMFDKTLKYLAYQFSAYLDMATGGEFRHIQSCTISGTGSSWSAKHKDNKLLYKTMTPLNPYRYRAWCRWKLVRQELGDMALATIESAYYDVKWSGAYGGKKWGDAVKVLRKYLSGELTPLVFVDTTWSMQHNCNLILNKAWNVHSLHNVLEAKVSDYKDDLLSAASAGVKQVWNEVKYG